MLLAVSLSPLALNTSHAARSKAQSVDEKAETSGTFYLSEKEPTKHLPLGGKQES